MFAGTRNNEDPAENYQGLLDRFQPAKTHADQRPATKLLAGTSRTGAALPAIGADMCDISGDGVGGRKAGLEGEERSTPTDGALTPTLSYGRRK